MWYRTQRNTTKHPVPYRTPIAQAAAATAPAQNGADADQNASSNQQRLDNMLTQQRHQIDTAGSGGDKKGPATSSQEARLLSPSQPSPWMTPLNAQLEGVRYENVNHPNSPGEWSPKLQEEIDAANNNTGGADMQHQNMASQQTGYTTQKGQSPLYRTNDEDQADQFEPRADPAITI
jgi:hypothetical protein